jgi:hypothetical protein
MTDKLLVKHIKRAGLAAAMIAASTLVAQAQSGMRMNDHFDPALLETDLFDALVSIEVDPKAIRQMSVIDLDVQTNSIINGEIVHHYIPKPAAMYRTKAVIGPKRDLGEEKREVRVVYAAFLPEGDEIDFSPR